MAIYYEVEFENGTNQVQNYAGDIGINIPIKSVNYMGDHAEITMPRVKVYRRVSVDYWNMAVVMAMSLFVPAVLCVVLSYILVCRFYYERVGFFMMPRSSICKKRLALVNSVGVIDRGYNGELKATVFSTNGNPIQPLDETPLFQVVLGGDAELYCSNNVTIAKERGEAGFGSSDNQPDNHSLIDCVDCVDKDE